MTHTGTMILFAACVAIVFATLLKDDGREQVRMGLRIFGGFVVSAYVLGWAMFGLFR